MFPTSILQRKIADVYTSALLAVVAFVKNGTTQHCLQLLRSAFELSNHFAAAILGLSKDFREGVTVTAQTIQIGNSLCHIYGEANAEYLLLQMTDEHDLQSMYNEVSAIAQSSHKFLFAAIPVEN